MFLLSFVFYYAAAHVLLLIGMRRRYPVQSNAHPTISVIVAARNEASNISRVLDALIDQSYRNIEILVANDRSTDATGDITASYAKKDARIRVINIRDEPADLPAKKNALTQAIRASQGEILCFTDADCLPGPRWVETISAYFVPEVGYVVGMSPYELDVLPSLKYSALDALMHRFVAYEENKSSAMSAGSIGIGFPWLCTGRNQAYRRKVFDEVGGFEQIKHSISGDDDLFLQLVRRRTTWKVSYVYDRAAAIPTVPPKTFRHFVNQRKRHFSAGKHYDHATQTLLFLYHVSNTAILIAFAIFILSGFIFRAGLFAIILKLVIDTVFLSSARSRMMISTSLLNVPYMEIWYCLYNAVIGPLGFISTFEWKPDLKR
ncbi:MAG: glycosyltransferase [Ignavibacteriales bacterium]|nr:glycosyltransferase [Ignavibacteriales bacterium]